MRTYYDILIIPRGTIIEEVPKSSLPRSSSGARAPVPEKELENEPSPDEYELLYGGAGEEDQGVGLDSEGSRC